MFPTLKRPVQDFKDTVPATVVQKPEGQGAEHHIAIQLTHDLSSGALVLDQWMVELKIDLTEMSSGPYNSPGAALQAALQALKSEIGAVVAEAA